MKTKLLPEDFLIRVNPHLTSQGKWNGGVEICMLPNLDNPLDDDDYFQIEHICKMLCGCLNFLETDYKFREKMNDYVVNTIDKDYIKEEEEKKYNYDNIVSVDFKNKTKH